MASAFPGLGGAVLLTTDEQILAFISRARASVIRVRLPVVVQQLGFMLAQSRVHLVEGWS